jgi:hypothetical protein
MSAIWHSTPRMLSSLLALAPAVSLAALMLVSGCRAGFMPAPTGSNREIGYSDLQVSPRIYRVSYVALRSAGRSRIRALAITRAAQLASQSGADSLRILEDSFQSFGGGFKGIGRRYRSVVFVQLVNRGDDAGWPPALSVDSILLRARRDGIELR